MTEKQKATVSNIFKLAGVTTLAGLLSFLSLIYVTKDSLAEWKLRIYTKEQQKQDLKINTVEINYRNIDKKLDYIIKKLEGAK